MSRFQTFEEIYSALFLDFDNIYTRLAEQDPALAHTFATNPQRWLRWLEGHALRMIYGDGVRRRILKRSCYIDPVRFQEFRPYFIRSAFHVVDCPPLTSYGKTSADINLVMDCMDALGHSTRFDEIIILSGDADFTPLLLRIQEHARRSLILSVGYTSPAYAAACSWRIREDWFLAQALEDPRDDSDMDNRQDHEERRHIPDRRVSSEKKRETQLKLPVYKRIRLVEAIKQLVAESSVPVPLPSVAQVLQREQEAPADWFGAGSLRDLLEVLDLTPIAFSASGDGFVYDPQRHEVADGVPPKDEFRLRHRDIYEFALTVHRLTETPILSPAQYATLFSLIADEVNELGFSRTGTVRHVEERCEENGHPINAVQIAFVVEAIIRGGVNLAASGKKGAPVNVTTLREAFGKSVEDLCRLSQIRLDEERISLLSQWFSS